MDNRALAHRVSGFLAISALLAACGGAPARSGGGASSYDGFVCNDRRAEYLLVGSFAAAEVGMSMTCDGDAPSLTKWYIEDGSAERESETFDISPAEFERLWQQLEDTGWRNLEDCVSGAAGDEQVATFDISDGDNTVSLTCQGKEQPFPFDRLANAFDELGRGYPLRR